ncbi:hypothetical protein Moror_10032 [Moniliophthora roreri MCA 2997]|uniref:DUF8040 domain-containing protein n=1 Tax=Moniliophthora roreri (strain MCA 2997) TaxID=1381753 RepID=V2WVH3_MONRO|nr:hypothetical protein Moror_10032 [Moniliophthora roreri MCA 2997]
MSEAVTPEDLARIYASAASVVHYASMAAVLYASEAYKSQPYHNSALTGFQWVQELIHGNTRHIYTELGVRLHVYIALVITLRSIGYVNSKKGVTVEEQIAIFLYMCITGLSVCHVGECFQRSNETIAYYFREMCEALSGPVFYN